MQIILNLLYIYVAIYTAYFFALSVRNLFDRKYKIEKRVSTGIEEENLAVVIYSHNNKLTLGKLINQIKLQNYPIDRFKIYVILDNCIDGSEELFENERYVSVINIKEIGTIGKDEAISQFIKRFVFNREFDAYVFIDGDRSIPVDFLSSVNSALKSSNVVCGETILLFENLLFAEKIKSAFQKYNMNFIQKARGLFGLACLPDSGVLAVRKPLLDQIKQIDFKNIDEELKYNLLLSKIKTPCIYNPNIQSCVETYEYEFKRPRLSTRLRLFAKCITQIFTKNWVFVEHVFSLLQPNICLTGVIYLLLLGFAYKYYFFVGFKGVVLTLMVFIVGFLLSLLNSRLNFKETVYLAMYPFYSVAHIVKHFPPVKYLTLFIFNKIHGIVDVEKFTIDVMVQVGQAQLPCKLEFISENDFAKVKFVYKRKSFVTQKHIRMIDALQELRVKLSEYGYVLRICGACEYFQSTNDGTKNMLKGCCNCTKPSITLQPIKETLVWNSCSEFSPSQRLSVYNDVR